VTREFRDGVPVIEVPVGFEQPLEYHRVPRRSFPEGVEGGDAPPPLTGGALQLGAHEFDGERRLRRRLPGPGEDGVAFLVTFEFVRGPRRGD